MKPIKLTMRAFGPYKNEEIIDFTELKNNRLFVISGSTGAGKTTIFDGICFALYGYGSGQDRKDTKMLRSDFAEDNIHTAVELVFDIHNKTYRVLRQLSHVKEGRKNATGEKYELFEIQNGQEVPVVERQRVTDINKKLEEIIGLSYDQFNQIVMLPQGEFRKLLTSQSDNKEAILRKIFKTDRYGEMAQKLEEKKKQAEQQLNEARALKNSIIAQISGALPKRESLLFSLLDQHSNIYQLQDGLDEEIKFYQQKMKEDKKQYEEALNKYNEKYELYVANKAINDRLDAYEKKRFNLQEMEQQKPQFDQMKKDYEAAIRASKIEPLNKRCHEINEEKQLQQRRLEQIANQLKQAQSDLLKAKEVYEIELTKQNERDAATKEVIELEKLLPLYEQIEKQTQVVYLITKKYNEAKSNLQQAEVQLEESRHQLLNLNGQVEQLEGKVQNLNETMEQQRYLREVVQTFTKYNEHLSRHRTLTEQFEKISTEYENARDLYNQEEMKWLSNQAALLAANLVPGSPCPVCGSTDHKTVNREHMDLIDEQALKNLKSNLSQIEQMKYNAQANLNASFMQTKQFEESLENLHAPIHEQNQYFQQFNDVNNRVLQLQKDAEQLAHLKTQLKQLKISHEKQDENRKQLEQNYQIINEQLVQQRTILEQQRLSIPSHLQELIQLQQALKEAKKHRDVLYQAWESAQKNLQTVEKSVVSNEEAYNYINQTLQQLEENLKTAKEQLVVTIKENGFDGYSQFIAAIRSEQEIQQLQESYMAFSNELHSLTTQVQEERQQLKGIEKVDLSQAQEQLNELKTCYENALQTLNLTKEYERHAIDFSDRLDRVAVEIHQLEEVSAQIIDLYNLLRGQNSKKISFERYVQMGYLEQITEAANIRLRNLSNGQYYLQCSDRQESHGRQSGLSLDVYDTYTGQSRDVKSLSGGEKFNASLCLALGMADVIQSFQGSVQIDTMFIDEGFGSLDEESLMKAIDTLIDLQKSGRMIGVISHVNELKAAMPAILEVVKLKEGYSRTKITLK
ncbi:AAA family ATPase [Lysinibacillus endophyticus]|uniref:AAA family ATPase n=1 Tax=Ureibacillus endophyticus TaxID=1978490 RepID=UPI0020A05F21|nr:SMC family ATPase [Lysinibacillus endophyticus]MCP1145990.1 SMC family ATPase [Lysinibacillus endophyticus]